MAMPRSAVFSGFLLQPWCQGPRQLPTECLAAARYPYLMVCAKESLAVGVDLLDSTQSSKETSVQRALSSQGSHLHNAVHTERVEQGT